MPLQLREYQKNDFIALKNIIRKTWRYDEFSSPKTASRLADVFLSSCLTNYTFSRVAVLNGKPVGIILVKDIAEAIAVSNEIAPEHLEVSVDEPFRYLADIRHAGSIFLGRNAPEALGDYFAGPNHTLPTSGTARFSSPLSVDDFVKRSSFTYYTKEALTAEAEKIGFFARREGLEAHARSALVRKDKGVIQ